MANDLLWTQQQQRLSSKQSRPDGPDPVFITSEMASRAARMPEYARENASLLSLLDACANAPETIPQVLVETAMTACDGDSAVLSLLVPGENPCFRWEATAGALTRSVGTTIPRGVSPCDIVMTQSRVQLLRYPQQHYTALPPDPPIVEALLAPFAVDDQPVGTLWVVAHSEDRHFDEECARLLSRLTAFAGIAQRLHLSTEALRGTEQALREADQRKDAFLAILAHELRNPLAPIRNAAYILNSAKMRPRDVQWAQSVISRQVTQMSRLLDDLLDISRITQNKIHLKKERVELTSVLDSAVEAARPLIDGKHQRISINLPSMVPAFQADPVRLTQVVTNLLTNAAKYTDAGGLIDLSARIDGETLILSVKDSGVGISADALAKIFQIFSQVDDTLSRADGGLGIGLALTKGLVELHGGVIEARSDGPQLGSEFVVRIPMFSLAPSQTGPSSVALTEPSVDRRVLVADDNRDAAESLALLLELAGYEVRVASSGQAAVTLARAFRPEIAIIDIGMSDMDGYEVAQSLRREPWSVGLVLIALTGWGQDTDRDRARAAGFDHYLTKPVDPFRIEALIGDLTSS